MRNLVKSVLIILFITILQLTIFNFFIKPIITTWGATKQDISMPMVGDDKTLTVISTRAILINAPKDEVWRWLIQLGADRNGFYSYTFIETALGYKTRHEKIITPKFKKIKVGDVVRGSIDEDSSIIPYNFQVLYVNPGESFVLNNWGTFLLKAVSPNQTRLIIRTQETKSLSFWTKTRSYIIAPLHYIMERRTLMGIKAHAEVRQEGTLSENKDVLWFIGIVSSELLICFLVFIGRGVIQSTVVPAILNTLWLLTLFLFNPSPLNSLGLLMLACMSALVSIRQNYNIKK